MSQTQTNEDNLDAYRSDIIAKSMIHFGERMFSGQVSFEELSEFIKNPIPVDEEILALIKKTQVHQYVMRVLSSAT